MLTPTESFELAELVFFGAAALPVLYCFWMHGKFGIGCWLNATILTGIRLAGNGLAYKALTTTGAPNIIALIVNGIGLSPLMLSSLGVLTEA